ncbi:MAG: TetR/AcrR family transcriptional regulator [Proteobacteria bacterium]|nr:TetR/AcrR family transcriptional regulator [Pseudomonadota bacterium]
MSAEGRIEAEAWVEAGLHRLASGGLEAVRVEVLAQDLGVTKGGFYRRFKDRRALLDAMLERWAEGRIEAIDRHTRLDGQPAAERLREIIALYAKRANEQGMAIELAVRQWARSDEAAAKAVARVDARRLEDVAELYAELGLAPDQARARAFLFYAYVFGQGLLPRAGDEAMLKACADLVVGG